MIARDTLIRMLANWFAARLTKRAPREEVIEFLAMLSPEERSGIWKLRTFYQRYNRGRKVKVPASPRGSYGPRVDIDAWASRVK